MTSTYKAYSRTHYPERLGRELLKRRKPIIVSNRGPMEYYVTPDGELEWKRGSGGVVTALTAACNYLEGVTWVAGAMTDGDRLAAQLLRKPTAFSELNDANLRLVTLPKSVFRKHYSVFCNPLLWFLQHYLSDFRGRAAESSVHTAWHKGYVPANKLFAQAVIEEAKGGDRPPLVMLHDYHLYLAAGYIKQSCPEALVQHFTHIPWPAPRYWQLLPGEMLIHILSSMCANDLVGFQTKQDVDNFLYCCQTLLPEAEVDFEKACVCLDGHLTCVMAYPISVDVESLKELAASPQVNRYEHVLRSLMGDYTVVRVDRMDPSKNILNGFYAFDLLLKRHPELVGSVKFLSFLVPSRTEIKEYRKYSRDVFKLIDRINQRYQVEGVMPIEVFFENNYPQAIAGLKLYDVLVVNSFIDGMNLVAKEGVTVNQRDGVLVLSETTGACQELREHTLPVAPADIEGTAEAMYQGLMMDKPERTQRAAALRRGVETHDITAWLCQQLEDIMVLA